MLLADSWWQKSWLEGRICRKYIINGVAVIITRALVVRGGVYLQFV